MGRGTNCSFVQIVPLFGECRHREAQPYTKFSVGNYFGVSWPSILPRGVKRGGGGLGESWEGNSSCTCNPCEGALKQIGSCKAKFGPTHHVYNNPTPSPISHFNVALFESNFGLLSCMLTLLFYNNIISHLFKHPWCNRNALRNLLTFQRFISSELDSTTYQPILLILDLARLV